MDTRREVYKKIQSEQSLPVCNEEYSERMIPFFLPMVVSSGESQHRYYAEDYAICERVKQAGFQIMADTTIRLGHIGTYWFGWEDAGQDVQRHHAYSFRIRRTNKE